MCETKPVSSCCCCCCCRSPPAFRNPARFGLTPVRFGIFLRVSCRATLTALPSCERFESSDRPLFFLPKTGSKCTEISNRRTSSSTTAAQSGVRHTSVPIPSSSERETPSRGDDASLVLCVSLREYPETPSATLGRGRDAVGNSPKYSEVLEEVSESRVANVSQRITVRGCVSRHHPIARDLGRLGGRRRRSRCGVALRVAVTLSIESPAFLRAFGHHLRVSGFFCESIPPTTRWELKRSPNGGAAEAARGRSDKTRSRKVFSSIAPSSDRPRLSLSRERSCARNARAISVVGYYTTPNVQCRDVRFVNRLVTTVRFKENRFPLWTLEPMKRRST